ncbi:hypothetical protein [Marinobacterium sp. MBR-109]|jgi:hypothetical protein|uniref:hypothetical protein n=1 Tax=Marinobacterium sp. MBR-109 TaxID=3156462 RepID=UPI003399D94F
MKAEQSFLFGGGVVSKPKRMYAPGELVDAVNYVQQPGGGYAPRKGYEYIYRTTPDGAQGSSTKAPAVFDMFGEGKTLPNVYAVGREGVSGAVTGVWIWRDGVKQYELPDPSPGLGVPMEPSTESPTVADTAQGALRVYAGNFYASAGFAAAYIGAGSVLYSWQTGQVPEARAFFGSGQNIAAIARFKDHLAVLAGESIYFSAVGDPMNFSDSTALQIGLGHTGVCLREYQGALFVSTRSSVYVIQGSTTADFQMRKVLDRGVESMSAVDGRLVLLTRDSGLVTLAADNVYGDFIPGEAGANLNDYIKAHFIDHDAAYPPALFMYFNKNSRQLVVTQEQQQLIDNPDTRGFVKGVSICMESPLAAMPIVNTHLFARYFEIPGTVIDPQTRYYATDIFGRIFQLDKSDTLDGTPMFGWMLTAPFSYGSQNKVKVFKKLDLDIAFEGEEHTIRIQSYANDGELTEYTTSAEAITYQALGDPDNSVLLGDTGIPAIENSIQSMILGVRLPRSNSMRINKRGDNFGLLISFDGLTAGSHTITGATVSYSPRRNKR